MCLWAVPRPVVASSLSHNLGLSLNYILLPCYRHVSPQLPGKTVGHYTNCYHWPSLLLLGILENEKEAKQDLTCFWYQRHTKFVNDYILYYGGKKEDFRRLGENDKTDMDVIRENHRFLWNEEDEMDMNWEKKLAKKYYDKLFKEYCIADLSRYKENKFGFRWRVEKEVISGKGQFFCGNKCCDKKEDLKSWEVNFGYIEHGEKRNALVKLRLCQECSFKLNFHHRRKEVKSKKRKDKTKKDYEESSHKKSRLSSAEETSKKKEKGHSSSKKSENSVNRDSDEEEGTSESELWKGPLPETDEKSQEEEFDDYFQDLFL
ncbi:protein FRA10AC1 isoform X1 [Ursus americanus]|uniref:FRA10A associated CGG repeat 1 n=1 Tax=Ursus americanus TaxID=9643 RepID=A0A452QA74_URSAM|nr:protein FRA10AC1 isoform X1 [Ursus americanus]XP_057164613.1 protein FRA10AC1 isoform X1 [Ursus arctos]